MDIILSDHLLVFVKASFVSMPPEASGPVLAASRPTRIGPLFRAKTGLGTGDTCAGNAADKLSSRYRHGFSPELY
jgi:hypothetical protein